MDHFNIVLALARAAMSSPNSAVTNHLTRLQHALGKDGATAEAEAIRALLDQDHKSDRIQPSRVVLSRAALPGEMITPSVRPPVDKETGTELAEVVLPSRDASAPILNSELRDAIAALTNEWMQIDRLVALDVRPPLSCLIFGAPGTGKTRLAHFIAGQLGMPLVIAKLDGLVSSFLGTTARNIAALFEFANRYQCILLLDEFDAIAKIRDDPHEVGEIKRVVNTMLQCLDARSPFGFTIAITNHEHLLDTAVWRRFDVRIKVPRPDAHARVAILARYLSPIELSEPEAQFLAWLTTGASGSEIEGLCNRLKRANALSDEKGFDLLRALRIHANLSADQSESDRYQMLLLDDEALCKAIDGEPDLSFTQEQLAKLFGNQQPTVSRWLRKQKAVIG